MSLDLSGNLVKFPDTDGDLTNLGRHRAEGIELRLLKAEFRIQGKQGFLSVVRGQWSVE